MTQSSYCRLYNKMYQNDNMFDLIFVQSFSNHLNIKYTSFIIIFIYDIFMWISTLYPSMCLDFDLYYIANVLITLLTLRTYTFVSNHSGLYQCKVGVFCTAWAVLFYN
jgi:hypothetical protein